MAWNYKGVEIELVGERFRAYFDDAIIFKESFSAVKKEIDKRQSVKALAVPLNLPVVILRETSRFSREKTERIIFHGAITGLDPESRSIRGIEAPNGWGNSEILPESKENTERLEKLSVARTELMEAEKSIEGREVSLYIPSLPKNRLLPYGDAVKRIKDNYENAKKEKRSRD